MLHASALTQLGVGERSRTSCGGFRCLLRYKSHRRRASIRGFFLLQPAEQQPSPCVSEVKEVLQHPSCTHHGGFTYICIVKIVLPAIFMGVFNFQIFSDSHEISQMPRFRISLIYVNTVVQSVSKRRTSLVEHTKYHLPNFASEFSPA